MCAIEPLTFRDRSLANTTKLNSHWLVNVVLKFKFVHVLFMSISGQVYDQFVIKFGVFIMEFY